MGELVKTKAATRTRHTLLINPTRLNNPEDTILHSHRRENLKSYIRRVFNISLKIISRGFKAKRIKLPGAVNHFASSAEIPMS
jgi:hypothetical protein